MFKKVLIGLGVLIAVFLAVVASRPAEFRVERSAVVSAPAAAVFAQVNDFHNWPNWSPWEKLDPAMTRSHSGAPAGAGAIYAWSGNKDVGEGRMTIGESRPNELIRITLEFFKPWKATNTTLFAFAPQGEQTAVTWTMTGRHNFVSKAFCLFMDMDKMVGGDFEKGLAGIKAVAEAPPAADAPRS